MSDEEVLSGGTLTAVVRVGDTVRRVTNVWSPNVHALLRHLQEKGFPGAPRFLGIDSQGRETLTFLHGDVTIDGPPCGMYTEASMSGAATLLRALHDATIDFVRGEPADWQFLVGAPRTGPVICHNDVGPYNTVYRAGRPVAFIDWDFAAPGPRDYTTDITSALLTASPLAECNVVSQWQMNAPAEVRRPHADGASRAVARLSGQRTAQTSPAKAESQRPRASWRQRPHTVYHHECGVLAGRGAFPCCTGPAEDRDLRFCPVSLA